VPHPAWAIDFAAFGLKCARQCHRQWTTDHWQL